MAAICCEIKLKLTKLRLIIFAIRYTQVSTRKQHESDSQLQVDQVDNKRESSTDVNFINRAVHTN